MTSPMGASIGWRASKDRMEGGAKVIRTRWHWCFFLSSVCASGGSGRRGSLFAVGQ